MAATNVPQGGVDVFGQAIESLESTLKASIKAQENSMNWWTEVMAKTSPLRDWQTQAQAQTSELAPLLRKNGEEALRAFNTTCQDTMDMAKRAFEVSTSATPTDFRNHVQELWEGQLGLVRKNTETMMQLGNRTAELWTSMVSDAKAMSEKPAGPQAN